VIFPVGRSFEDYSAKGFRQACKIEGKISPAAIDRRVSRDENYSVELEGVPR
jgi:hypothetical protein